MADRSYDVGYGKPPVHTRFPKGQSGCPSGGSKPKKSISQQLDQILAEKVTVTEGSKTQRMRKEEVFLRQLVARAISGDRHASRSLLDYLTERQQQPDAKASSATDEFLMAELSRMISEQGESDNEPPAA